MIEIGPRNKERERERKSENERERLLERYIERARALERERQRDRETVIVCNVIKVAHGTSLLPRLAPPFALHLLVFIFVYSSRLVTSC